MVHDRDSLGEPGHDLHVVLDHQHGLRLVAVDRADQLDEPMAGVSAENVPELVALIGSIHRDEGKTVLMVEHHMEVVTRLAQRIAVMHLGALLACDTPKNVMANETVQSAYLGEEL